jgi:nucleotide-binding universal stress UspA family protein
MKNILVPIDFSKYSMHALEHALMLTGRINAGLRIIHVRKNKNYDKHFIIKGSEISYEKKVRNFCEEIIKKYKNRQNFDYVIARGKVYAKIVEQAQKDKTDMIIMGTHGVSGFEEFWLGSNSYRVVCQTPCPVLTIQYGFRNKNITKIVLPIDAYRETRQKVPFTAALANMLGAEIHIIEVRSTNESGTKRRLKKYADQVYDYVTKRKIKTVRDSVYGKRSITDLTISYAVHVGAELISIVTNQRGTPVNMRISTTAQQMVNHSPIPVLSIHPFL